MRSWNYTTASIRKRNKIICKRYPFLIPRIYNGKISWEADKKEPKRNRFGKYSFTLAEDFPAGWWKAFGIMMCEELREDLIRNHYLYKYRVAQIKEKYGQLRFYDYGIPTESHVWDIIEKYSILSENICIRCGKPDVYMTNMAGWYSPYCEDCVNLIEKRKEKFYDESDYKAKKYSEFIPDGASNMMANKMKYIIYQKGDKRDIEADISETANRIREKWNNSRKKE